MRTANLRGLLVAVASMALAACSSQVEEDSGAAAGASSEASSSAPQLCAAVRGNGESILTHFASLSQIVEHYGVVDGMAGGSSGSISTFTYESILRNPSMKQDASRIALALKSVEGYANVVGDSEEAASIKGFVGTIAKLKAEYAARGIPDTADSAAAATQLQALLSIPELKAIVNPEIFAMLADTAHLEFNVAEIKTSITQLGAFSVDDNRLFFRTGVLNWPALASLFGRVGDFYAGYGPSDKGAMGAWLDACAEPTRGKPWAEAATVSVGGGTCGSLFEGIVKGYRAKVRSAAPGSFHSRIDDKVGDPASPLRKLISTAVLERSAVTSFEAARARYVTGEFPAGSIPFAPAFSDVNFGYWGSDADLAAVGQKAKAAHDLKSQKFSSLGNATWREILAASPAEPGLSRLVKLKDGRYSAGGWSDLAPSLALKDLGCQHVVYVTREGDESGFATKIAKNLGMSESNWSALYDLQSADSSYAASVAAADAVWCTNWNAFKDSEMNAMVLDAFNAPFETRASFADVRVRSPYGRATARTGKAGCTPGVSAGAQFPR